MTLEPKSAAGATVRPLTLSRVFKAPRERVFKAWSHADHIRRWFSPEGCSVPVAEVDFRIGGAFVVCMRLPDGAEHWSRGTFLDIAPPTRIVIEIGLDADGARRFNALTEVTFEAVEAGTRMTVHQSYEFLDPAFVFAAEGAPEGWRTTLDKLEREVARIAEAPARTATHGMFTIRRSFAASPAKVYRALTQKQAKARWFVGPEGVVTLEREMDVRVGGRERLKAKWTNGMVSCFDAVYFDVVPNERLVYAYEMHLDERKISVSLATMQILPEGEGSQLIVTEQGAFLDGYDDAGSREQGTNALLDRLAASLAD